VRLRLAVSTFQYIMKTWRLFILVLGFVLLVVTGFWAYRHWEPADRTGAREEMLSLLPSDPSTVVFVDLEQFRKSSFLPQLLAWMPHDSVEDDYAQFVKATGFNYERDLDRAAIAVTRLGNSSTTYAIAEGKFDRKKVEAYAKQNGHSINDNGLQLYGVNLKNSTRTSFFTFLRDDRIAWTDDPEYRVLFLQKAGSEGKGDWQEHFSRLAGSAVFAVMREDTTTAAALEQQAPGGFRSPQLATLLSQLQWITIGGKPEENNLRVVIEGESASESSLNQLKEFLQGILVMAQVGLNGAQNRKQMDAQLREAYLGLLKSAEVEKVDRGTGKSVRIVFELTPGLLEALKKASEPGAAGGH
jgi:hypothetical protein